MQLQAVQIVLEPPAWPVLLTALAAGLLTLEAGALLLRSWRRTRNAWGPLAAVVSIAAGPVVSLAAAGYQLMSGIAPGRSGTAGWLVLAGLRGTLIATCAVLTARWIPGGGVITLGAVAVLWSFRSYSRTTTPVKRKVKAVFLALRVLIILLLTLWTLGPKIERRTEKEVRGIALVGVDLSGSMSRRDMPLDYRSTEIDPEVEPIARIAAVRQALRDQDDSLEEIAEQSELELFTFDVSSRRTVPLAENETIDSMLVEPDGPATALGDSGASAFGQFATARRDVVALILLSDGCNNTADVVTPEKFARLMASRNIPVYTVGVGWDTVTQATHQLNLRNVAAPDQVEAFNRLPITAAIDAIGLAGTEIKLTCTFGDEEVGTKTITASENNQTLTARFEHVPTKTGYHRLAVKAEIQGEKPRDLTGKFSADKLVQVRDTGIRILYVEGKIRFEVKFITQALASGRRITVDRHIFTQPLGQGQQSPLGEKMEDWLRYHAVILGDVQAANFTDRQLEILAEMVTKHGKGLCMIGGTDTFGQGNWPKAIRDIMPVDLQASTGQIKGPIKVIPTDQGAKVDLMRIGPKGEVADPWRKLRPLPGANRLAGVKLGATVLAESGDGAPMIVRQKVGAGRTLAIAFDTTYRWVLTPDEETPEMQKRFWRQVGLYLAAPRGNIWIATDQPTYDLRRLGKGVDVVEVTAGVEDAFGRPLLSENPRIELVDPDGGRTPLTLRPGETSFRGTLPAASVQKEGVYQLHISHMVEDKELKAEHRFEVVFRDLESLDVLANFDLLRRMASESNGLFVRLAELPELLEELRITTRPRRVEQFEREELGKDYRWWLLGAILAMMCVEWAVRKRKGLI